MPRRIESITVESLGGLYRHHPYLLLLQKEDWQSYLLLLAQIYDVLEEKSERVPIESIRALMIRFFSGHDLASVENKVSAFLAMAISELEALKDSHDQFGQRYLEPTRSGKALLQLIESLVTQRNKFTGTGAEVLLGSLNDILVTRTQMSVADAIEHHKAKIAAYRDDIQRIKDGGLEVAQLLPIAHTNEALFTQAEESAIHILNSIEDVKAAIEEQRKEVAAGYFQSRRSAGETLTTVADFYEALYSSPQYTSYVQAKELLSHLEGFQSRFPVRNVDKLVHTISTHEFLSGEMIQRSNLRSFMSQFWLADSSIQEKVKEQIRILQLQVLYSVSTDVLGLSVSLHELLSQLVSNSDHSLDFWDKSPVVVSLPFEMGPAEVRLFDFELPPESSPHVLAEDEFDFEQQKRMFLALLAAEDGTLDEILSRLRDYLKLNPMLSARTYTFPKGLAEYYILSEVELFNPSFGRFDDGSSDIRIESKHGEFILRNAPAFTLRLKESLENGKAGT